MKYSNKGDYLLYLVTDRLLIFTSTIEEAVDEAIKGGITMLQLREKDMGSREFYDEAMRIRVLTNKAQIPLIINDRLDIALACDADGLHIGQDDLPIPIAREILGSEKILGVSASSVKEAVEAERYGADYLGVGAMYRTLTKTDASFTSFEELNKIISSVSIPIVVIGGINSRTIEDFANYDISGFAIVSDIIASNTIYQSTKRLKECAELIIK